MAIKPLLFRGFSFEQAINSEQAKNLGEQANNLGSMIFQTIESNLSNSGYFKLISQEAFLEKPGEKEFEPYPKNPKGFRWKNWQLLKTDYLVLSSYSLTTKKVQVDLYLYHIPLKRKVFQKQYQTALAFSKKLAHKMSDDIVLALTKNRSIFLTKILAQRSMSGSKKEIFVMDWNGENKKQISFHKSVALSPSWSKDGKYIAYTAFLYRQSLKRRTGSLILFNRSMKTRRIVSQSFGTHLGFDFLPNGKHILLSLFLGRGQMDIAKMSLKDGSIKAITFGPNNSINVEPVVHPNGKKILFSSDRGGKVMIYSMSINGKNIRPITWQGTYNSTPDYSPDGKSVVFSGLAGGRFDIFIMNADGSQLRRLTSFKKMNGRWANHESPSFSPDGRYIVFTSNRTGKYQLYIMNLLNLRTKRITMDSHNYKSPRWSPFLVNNKASERR